MNSNMPIKSEVPIPKNKVKSKPVATQERMITRSQARQVEEEEIIILHVNPSKNRRIIKDDAEISPRRSSRINFDEASVAWRSNKRSVGNGQFEYVM
jgi:methylphosphotriester-DNA--protein-cysteine methyltransferase